MSDIIEIIQDVTTVTLASDGPQGPQGPTGATGASGVVSVVAPITNTGTSTSAIIGINAGVAGGVATLDGTGKVPQNQLPAVAITNTFVVNSQAAMLALTAEEGDVAVRTDLNKSFILTATPSSTLANWQELLTPTDSVLSVDGLTGAVDLTTKYAQLAVANSFTAQNIINASGTSTVDLIVRATSGQTADLQQWQNSSSTVLSFVRSDGFLFTPGLRDVAGTGAFLNTGATTAISINTRTLTNIGLIIQGVASQSANLQEWQNSGGTANGSIDSTGYTMRIGQVRADYFSTNANTNGYFDMAQDTAGSVTLINRTNAANVLFIVKGMASQTGDLQQWRNSAGTVMGYVSSIGVLRAEQLQTNGANVWLRTANNGGVATFNRTTSTPSNVAANYANLYFRDGTVPGTLKFVVRAGAAGAETTILDNIPQ
jgi:hypothetical protein